MRTSGFWFSGRELAARSLSCVALSPPSGAAKVSKNRLMLSVSAVPLTNCAMGMSSPGTVWLA